MKSILHSIDGYRSKFSDSDDDETGYDMRGNASCNNMYSKISNNSQYSIEKVMINMDTFDKRIKPNDTLTSLALRYDCKVSNKLYI